MFPQASDSFARCPSASSHKFPQGSNTVGTLAELSAAASGAVGCAKGRCLSNFYLCLMR